MVASVHVALIDGLGKHADGGVDGTHPGTKLHAGLIRRLCLLAEDHDRLRFRSAGSSQRPLRGFQQVCASAACVGNSETPAAMSRGLPSTKASLSSLSQVLRATIAASAADTPGWITTNSQALSANTSPGDGVSSARIAATFASASSPAEWPMTALKRSSSATSYTVRLIGFPSAGRRPRSRLSVVSSHVRFSIPVAGSVYDFCRFSACSTETTTLRAASTNASAITAELTGSP